MWSFLGSIVNGFLLLRDFFGYVIPGAVLLAIVGWFYVDPSQLPMSGESIWGRTIAVITASYTVGHVLAAIGYSLYNGFDKLKNENGGGTEAASATDADVVYFRYLYPSMFIESDRRETLTILRVGLSVALLIGGCFIPIQPLRTTLVVTGLFMFCNAYFSRQQAGNYRDATIAAARAAEQKPVPIFPWGGGGKTDDGKTSKDEP
jgi:hypothetical protein